MPGDAVWLYRIEMTKSNDAEGGEHFRTGPLLLYFAVVSSSRLKTPSEGLSPPE